MARDDRIAPVNNDWIIEAKFVNAVGNLPNLSLGMYARIVWISFEGSERLIRDFQTAH